MLDIKLEQRQGMSCDETVLASVALWFNRRYEMLFSHNWNFSLTAAAHDSPGMICKRIKMEKVDPFSLMKHHHGIRTTWHSLSHSPRIFKIAAQELKRGFPVSVIFDYQYLSIVPQKKRSAYYHKFPMIVLEIDPVNQGVYCLDVHFLKKVIFLTFENFCAGYQTFTTYDYSGGEKKVNWPEILKYNTKRLMKNDAFHSLRRLAELIGDSLDYEIEKNYHDINGEPLIADRIKAIYNSRFLFSHMLTYLIETQKAEVLAGFREEFEKLSKEWFSAWGILALALRQRKLNVERDFGFQMRRVSQKIIEIADHEERLCQQINQIMAGNRTIFPKSSLSEPAAAGAHPIHDYLFVDIQNYLNNEAFATGMDQNPSADFNGAGQFFLAEGLPQEEIWNFAGMKFKFPVPADGVKDNFTCLGQVIAFPQAHYGAMLLLGCSDWGHQSEMIDVYYTDGTRASLALEFPNWAYDSRNGSFSRESLIWEGKCAEKKDGVVAPITLSQGHLFGLMLPLASGLQLDRIQLPDCRNIHLFGITLGR